MSAFALAVTNEPATRTLPFPRRVAVAPSCPLRMLAALSHVFVAGSYSSAVARGLMLPPPVPPATRTSPFSRRVAVWSALAVAIDGAGDHGLSTPAAGAVMDRTNEPTSTAAPHAARKLRAILIPPQPARRLTACSLLCASSAATL